MLHQSNSRHLSGALLGALAMVSMQGCKQADTVTWIPVSSAPTTNLEDSVLTSRVRAALVLSPLQRSSNIGIGSHNGVVLLSGMVADQTQLDLAVFVAQNVPGVEKVDSFMFSAGVAPVMTNRLGFPIGELRVMSLLKGDRSADPTSVEAAGGMIFPDLAERRESLLDRE